LAQLFPDIETIKKLHQKPTKGELKILDFLVNSLDSDFEIYFQPFIDGDRPDIIVIRENVGALIIEVKDWKLDKYGIDDKTNWYLKKNNQKIKSPSNQVNTYKYNLYDLHIEKLLPNSLRNKYYYTIVNTIVYFHNENEANINDFIFGKFKDDRYRSYRKSLKYIHFWGYDSLTGDKLKHFLKNTRLDEQSKLFGEELYNSFKRYLLPPFHMIEEGKDIKYTPQQLELTRSEQKPRRKIKGIAGCGKTFVLAKRAVNAYRRTKSKILILTYNLSLKNYIHDRINDVREEFPWDNFYITNYHQFIKTEANNNGLEINSLEPFSDTNFFEPIKNNLKKYKTILIDEVQDYETSWLEIITKYFLIENGEFVVFGDEKQNIYNRKLDESKEPITVGIPGKWNKTLNMSKRFTNEIGVLALEYQKEFMAKKYTPDELRSVSEIEWEDMQKIMIYYNFGIEVTAKDLYIKYVELIKKYEIHPSDICILSATVEPLRKMDFLIRDKLRERTTTTFETKEFWDKLTNESRDESQFYNKIENIRRNKKNHFWMKTGTTKLSSIHSFKGWESHTLFLLIETERGDDQFRTIELIYTALTRAQINLFIFNMGNSFYDEFFCKHMDDQVIQ
jgi:hypothetical protein